jgi:peptide deformylase
MKYKIIRKKEYLRKPTTPVATEEEGQKIADMLWEALKEQKYGIGLSANQIGINKSVSVVNVDAPLVLMNPKIVNPSKEMIIYQEGCLSIPGKITRTIRHKSVTVSCLNWTNELTFQPTQTENSKMGEDKGLLEAICIQHEIDHLNGILMTDRGFRNTVHNSTIKFGRNEKVMVEKDGETQFIKYKYAQELIEKDGWKLI